jgi:hypothetical protein
MAANEAPCRCGAVPVHCQPKHDFVLRQVPATLARVIEQIAAEVQELSCWGFEIIGDLGGDPNNGSPTKAYIRVAVNSRRRGADGERVKRTDWFRRLLTMDSKAEDVHRFTCARFGRLACSGR